MDRTRPSDKFEADEVENKAEMAEIDESSPWHRRLERMTDGRLFLLIAVPLLVLYLASATWARPDFAYHIDPFTNVLSSWELGTDGSFFLDDHGHLTDPDHYRNLAWVVPAGADGDRAASQYPPGTTLLAAPLYAVWPHDARLVSLSGLNRPEIPPVDLLFPSVAPAAIIASIAVAAAIGLLGVVFRRFARPVVAVAAAYVAGLGTSAWSVAADQLWQHGPAMLWIALALILSARYVFASGFAWGAAVLTRPPLAVIAAATGLYRAWRERSFRPAVLTGIGAAIGLGLFMAYNQLIFESLSLSAGYGTSFEDQARSGDLLEYGKNLFLGVFSASRGFLIWSPFLVVLIPGLPAAWKAAPAWVRGSALGGLLYLLVQYKANRYSGGAGFYAYRYPLEALTAAAPLLFLSYREWISARPRAMRIFVALIAASVVIHAYGAFA